MASDHEIASALRTLADAADSYPTAHDLRALAYALNAEQTANEESRPAIDDLVFAPFYTRDSAESAAERIEGAVLVENLTYTTPMVSKTSAPAVVAVRESDAATKLKDRYATRIDGVDGAVVENPDEVVEQFVEAKRSQ